jgi:hypothetical protein
MSKIIPTLYLGLGGTGFYAISEIKKNIANKYFKGNANFPLTSFLAIDTEFLSADKVEKLKNNNNSEDVEFIATFDASNIKDIERIETTVVPDDVKNILKNPALTGLEDFVPERADECIEVKGDGASGVGLVGKIALANNFSKIASTVKNNIEALLGSDATARLKSNHLFSQYDRESRMNVFIFCSFGGGTGKGMALIIAAMAKELLHEQFHGQRQKYNITIVNYLPACFRARGRSVANDESTYQYILKNQYATYKEFEWCMSNGYNNEKFFKTYFNKQGNKPKTEDFINSIYNVSTNLENSGTEIDSYDAINKIVSEVFTFLVMNPESHAILQSVSNDTQKTETAIKEKGTGLSRNRKYGRIGRYNLIMPEKELFEYAKNFYTQRLLKDFLYGGIEKGKSYKEITGPEGKPENKPEELSRKKGNEILNIFDNHFNRCPQLSPGELHYPDARNYQLSNFVNPISSEIRSLESYKTGFVKEESLDTAKEIIDEFILQSIRFSGLLFARDFLKEINICFERTIQQLLDKIGEKNSFSSKEILKGLGNEDSFLGTIEVDEFEFSVSAGVLNRLNQKYEESLTAVYEYTSPEKFKNVESIINHLIKPKKRGFIKKLFNTVDDEKIPFPENAKSEIFGITNKLNKELAKIWPIFRAKEYVNFANTLHEHVNNRFNKINDFVVLLNGEDKKRAEFSLSSSKSTRFDKNGMLKKIESILLNKSVIPREANESNIIGDNEYEFRIFAQNILPYASIIKDVHSKFNHTIVDEIFSSRVKVDSDDLYYHAMKFCEQRLSSERFDNGNPKWTILNYMQYLLYSGDDNEKQQIEENLLKIKRRSSFLSSIDTNKFENPGAAESSFPQQNFLEISDKNFFPSNIKGWEEYTHRAKLIPQENENEITLTRVQGLIPLFAFTDLQLAQNLYNKSLHSSDDVDEKHKFKVKTHSSAFFMEGIDEPFGQTLQIDKTDIKSIWNIAYHLGVVNVNQSDYVQMITNGFSSDFTDYYDPSKSQVRNKANTRIKVIEYRNSFINYFHLTNRIIELLFDRMEILAEHTMEGRIILKKYFTDIKYPILPKPLFDMILNKLEERKYGELVYFAKVVEQDYLNSYEKVADGLMKKKSFVTRNEELLREYKGSSIHTSFFKGIFSGETQKKETEANQRLKLEKINSKTKWHIIIEEDKNEIISSDDGPMIWKEIDEKYKELDFATVERNLYALDLDLIVPYEEFERLIPKLTLQDLVLGAGFELDVLDIKFHAISKKNEKKIFLTENDRFSFEELLETIEVDNTLYISDKGKPKRADDWKYWKEHSLISRIVEHKNNLDKDDEIFLPDF